MTRFFFCPALSALFFLVCSLAGEGHPLDSKLCEEFLAVEEIYLIDSEINQSVFTTSGGEEFTLEDLVRHNWPEKKVIVMKDAAYNSLRKLKKRFYISLASFKVVMRVSDYVSTSTEGIVIGNGKTGKRGKNILYWVYLNLSEIQRGVKVETLKYAVGSMQYMIKNHREGGKRKKFLYQTEGLDEILSKSTLYLNIDDLEPELQTEEAIRAIYPYDFVLETYWGVVGVLERNEGEIVFLDFVDGGETGAVNVFSVAEERLIISGAPILGNIKINRSIFKKLFL